MPDAAPAPAPSTAAPAAAAAAVAAPGSSSTLAPPPGAAGTGSSSGRSNSRRRPKGNNSNSNNSSNSISRTTSHSSRGGNENAGPEKQAQGVGKGRGKGNGNGGGKGNGNAADGQRRASEAKGVKGAEAPAAAAAAAPLKEGQGGAKAAKGQGRGGQKAKAEVNGNGNGSVKPSAPASTGASASGKATPETAPVPTQGQKTSRSASQRNPRRPQPIPVPTAGSASTGAQPRSISTTSAVSATSADTAAAPPVIRSLHASISPPKNALDAAREAAGEKNVDNALSSLQKMISDLKLIPPAANAAGSTGSSPVGSRSASGPLSIKEGRDKSRSPVPANTTSPAASSPAVPAVPAAQPVSIPGASPSAGTSSAKLKADAPTFTPSFQSAASPHSVSPSISLGPGHFNDRSASMSSERRTSNSSIGTINPYAGLTSSHGHPHAHVPSSSFSQLPHFPLANLPGYQHYPGVPESMGELPSLAYNEQYQQLVIAQHMQVQQIQLLQAQISANQLAAQQAQQQAQQSGNFTAPRFRALAEQRQAQQAQQQMAALSHAQQIYDMQQQALKAVQEAHAKAAAQATLRNPPPVFEEDDEPEQQARGYGQAGRPQLNPGFTFGARRQEIVSTSTEERKSMSPPQQTVVVDRQQGIGGAQATGLAGLAARAHKRTGSELTPAMQQQLELQNQIEALQAKQKALMEEEFGSQGGSALSQLSNIVKSPPMPSQTLSGHRRVQSSFPSAEPRATESGSLLEQTRPKAPGEMPPPPVPTTHNRRHSVNVFAKGAGSGSGFSAGASADIPEDEVPAPSHRRGGSRSGFESGNWRSISSVSQLGIGPGGGGAGAGGGVTDLASAQAQLASLAQFRAAAGGGHNRMASFALPNMLPNLLAATTLSSPGGTSLFQQQQAFQLQLQQNSSGPQRKSLFAPYLPQASLPPLLQAGKLVVGILRVNKKNRSDAYVATDVLEADIYICGSKDRNRALEGDIVAVELLDVDEVWHTKKDKEEKKRKKEENSAYDLKPSTRKQLEKKKDDVEVEGQGLLLFEDEEVNDETKPTYAGHVVAVVERMPGQLFSGQLGVLRPSSAATKEKQEAERRERGDERKRDTDASGGVGAGAGGGERPKIVWFKPTDKRVPLIAIPTEQAPVDFIEDPDKWADKLFVATIKRWPITSLHPFGTLVEELGPIGDVEVETSALLKDCNFPTEEFGEQAIKCLPPLPWSIPDREYEIRQDLREERIFTIDPPNAKDLDDALSVRRNEDGTVRVGVHIADVSYFVKPNTALDREARKRATSVYLVQRAVPMLPPQLSEQLCSLIPDVERLAFSAFFDIDADGRVVRKSFARSIIKSCAKLSYSDAQSVVQGSGLPAGKVTNAQDVKEVEGDLRLLKETSALLRARRVEAGAITSDNKLKVSFTLDERGNAVDVDRYPRVDSNVLVEEFMLLANTSVAHIIANGLPEQALLRRHEAPIERRTEGFVRRAKLMGVDIDASTSKALQESFGKVEDADTAMCLELMKRKAMSTAKYFCTGMLDIAKYSHWALNTPLYAHFTSPIRRYADVIVHRMLDSCLNAPNPNDVKFLMDRDQVAKVSQQCNMKKASARLAEEQSIHLHLCMLIHDLTEKYGPVVREGEVTGVLDAAFDVVIPEFAIEKRVHVDKLPIDNNVFDEHKNVLSLYWTQKDVLSYLCETTDDPALASLRLKSPSPSTGAAPTAPTVPESKQYRKSADAAAGAKQPVFENLRQSGAHKIQDIKELASVPVVVVADVSKSPPVLMVYGVNPYAQ